MNSSVECLKDFLTLNVSILRLDIQFKVADETKTQKDWFNQNCYSNFNNKWELLQYWSEKSIQFIHYKTVSDPSNCYIIVICSLFHMAIHVVIVYSMFLTGMIFNSLIPLIFCPLFKYTPIDLRNWFKLCSQSKTRSVELRSHPPNRNCKSLCRIMEEDMWTKYKYIFCAL